MKRILLCFFLLLAFLSPLLSSAAVQNPVHSATNFRGSTANLEGARHDQEVVLLDVLMEISEDDTNDSEDEVVAEHTGNFTGSLLLAHYHSTNSLIRIRYSGYFFSLFLPLFILLQVFRL